ncbi:MAG: serine protein kinase [Calditrichia bacterium]|nr:serine protein kinase [Calditrichota bacterium]MCB0268208.1 serine protein kinase [Calditrichota bacterium]MCB9068725.1 serine protein kinase [Calditrichia bacterium]
MAATNPILEKFQKKYFDKEFRALTWTGTFEEYLEIVKKNPRILRTSYQRLYDMILSFGTEDYEDSRKKMIHYNFFDDPVDNGKDAVYGLDAYLMKLMNALKSAAYRYGTEKRVLLLHGPVGSSKSTIVRLMKKGLEHYSRTEDGAIYSYEWIDIPKHFEEAGTSPKETVPCPMHQDPLFLVPDRLREEFMTEVLGDKAKEIYMEGSLNPTCRQIYREMLKVYDGDWTKVLQHVRVKRILLSEKDRIGIGTFQPKDEKNQDSTELTGDINYRKIAEYGSDSDPRAFNFDGEFNIANRGLVEFIEMLKLDVAFLYDLLSASQEHKIKPKKFPQTDIDEVIIGHTNEPEYRKLQNNEFMEALRDRTVKIDIPYITKWTEEIKIYKKDYNNQKIRGKFIAPHTIEMAAMWAVLTRLEEPKKANLTLPQKLRLYDGKLIPGYTEDNVRELRKEARREGLEGISPRYVQDKISNAIVKYPEEPTMNPFMVLNELEAGLDHHSLITNEELKKRYRELIKVVKSEYTEIVKNEVQRAISADEDGIKRLFANYIDNVKAYVQREKVKNKFTGDDEDANEKLMRSIEEKIDIPESRKDDFRREIMNYIGALSLDNKKFEWRSNDRLAKALELKLFEDQKDSIKLSSLVSNVMDKETQEKIDIVKSRLIKGFGYDEHSATDVLNYVASIFARGDIQS